MDGLLSMFEEQFKKGEPYRDAFRGLLRGNTSGLKKLNAPTPVNPNEALDVAMTFAPLGITAFHGSPYQFSKFDPAKIGSGEGAQAFGHGLYFAENPNVAKGYAKNVKDTNSIQALQDEILGLDNTIKTLAKNPKTTLNDIEPLRNKQNELIAKRNAIDWQSEGNLYKVDIDDKTIPKMLDWDKPLSEQKNILPQAQLAVDKIKKLGGNTDINNMTGRDLYLGYQAYRGNQPDFASEGLREMGIPGIRYLDQSSREAGKGTSNYVVFDPNTVKILERNGLLLP